ncbi:hypothetical protein HPB50_029587 [Hyalomma asiaticum]|nr:hypothetical protein HPB50_029587 [Hyalomma asiaticum]
MSVAEMSFVTELESIGQTLLRVPVPSKQEQQSALQKAAILYRSCDSVRQGTHDELNAVRQALRSEDIVWPRRSSKPDVLRTLIRSSLVLHWGAIFDVTLEAKSRDVFVRIEPSRMFAILHDRFVELYDGISEREAYFSILRANFKDDDADLLDFRTVNDLDTAAFSTLPQRVDRSSYDVALDTNISLGGADHVTEDEWREAVNPFVPSNETGRIIVSTRSETFFLQFLELWKATGRESMHTFLSWCVVQVAAPYANEQLQINLYGSKGRAHLVHGASCLARAFLIAGTEVFSAYNDIVMDDRTRFAAHKLIQSVCRTFLLRLHNWEHFNADVQVLQKRETGEVPWHVVHASFVKGEDSAVDMTDSLVQNWRNAPVPHTAGGFLRSDVYSAIEYATLLVLMDRDFVLMPYALALPHFDGDATAALNYAGIGSTTAFALAKLLIAAYGASVADVASIFPSHHCVGNQMANATASDEELLAMLRAAAIRTSFYAYQREWGTEDYAIKGLEGHSSEEVFFMASCFALCSGGAEDGDDGEACNAHLRRVDQFASAFKCDPGTPMNPATNCSTMQWSIVA